MDQTYTLSTELKQLVSSELAWNYHIIPFAKEEDIVTFYFAEKEIEVDNLRNELFVLLGYTIVLLPKSEEWILRQLRTHYPNNTQTKIKQKSTLTGDNSQTDFLIQIIEEAAQIKSSDIHLEAYEERCRVRFRIDGKLVERYVITKYEYPALINKIKIKANLDIAEKRLPQDGRIIISEEGLKMDIRVSVLPTLHGEKTVLRLLNRDATQVDLNVLGFEKTQHNQYLEGIKKPNGIILVSGPTGSGKTTTLYATLKLLNNEDTNILTIEDPIEYTLEGINQVQLKEAIGLNFASAMRTFLRQDPDIIMLGEIRDEETARMAVRAALTGHLVLSTIHTNSAWGTVTRLVDMGVPAYLIASTLNLSVAQRLVRQLCPNCKKKVKFNVDHYPSGFVPPKLITDHYIAVGCDKCYHSGYAGRKALYEIIPMDNEFRDYIRNEVFDITNHIEEKKVKLLSEVAFNMFCKGDTSIQEVYAILGQ